MSAYEAVALAIIGGGAVVAAFLAFGRHAGAAGWVFLVAALMGMLLVTT